MIIRMDVDEIMLSTLSFVLTGFFVCNYKAALDSVGTQDMGIISTTQRTTWIGLQLWA